jgi:hypothetical protein
VHAENWNESQHDEKRDDEERCEGRRAEGEEIEADNVPDGGEADKIANRLDRMTAIPAGKRKACGNRSDWLSAKAGTAT